VPQTKVKSIPTRRNRQYEKRLSSINKAAARIIARDGFEGASVRRVAAKAKIGLSGIYYYYKSKEDLLYALQKHAFSSLVRSLRERLQAASTPEEKLQAVIDNHFQFFVDNVDELKVCVHEIESLSGEYYKKVLEIRRDYFSLVREVVREAGGGNPGLDPNLASLFLFGSLNWVYMWYNPQKNADTGKLSKQLGHIFLNGMKMHELP
jgi:AcrR family transcriptional regulator